jgi:hypothetical protein
MTTSEHADGDGMPRISEPLYQVTPDDVEEVLFGVDGEDAVYRQRRDGDNMIVYGETGSGRLLKLVSEFMKDGRFRVFAARDMDSQGARISGQVGGTLATTTKKTVRR